MEGYLQAGPSSYQPRGRTEVAGQRLNTANCLAFISRGTGMKYPRPSADVKMWRDRSVFIAICSHERPNLVFALLTAQFSTMAILSIALLVHLDNFCNCRVYQYKSQPRFS